MICIVPSTGAGIQSSLKSEATQFTYYRRSDEARSFARGNMITGILDNFSRKQNAHADNRGMLHEISVDAVIMHAYRAVSSRFLSLCGMSDCLDKCYVTRYDVFVIKSFAVRETQRLFTTLMALRLARLFGNSPAFWLRAQQARNLWESEQKHRNELARIQPPPIAA
jgi:hypothetical protein